MNQISNVIAANRNMTEEVDKNFQFNQWAPWADKAQANSKARQAAADMTMSGIDTFGSSLMSGLEKLDQESDYNDYFKKSPGNSPWGQTGRSVQSTSPTIDRSNLAFNPAPTYLSNARTPNLQNGLIPTGDLNFYNNPDSGDLMQY